MRARLTAALILAVVTAGTADAQQPATGERYYMTLFGAQSVPFRTRNTHTFATFTRVADGGASIESHTVSWLPATLKIRPLALRPEPGVNLSLEDTLRWVGSFDGRVSAW